MLQDWLGPLVSGTFDLLSHRHKLACGPACARVDCRPWLQGRSVQIATQDKLTHDRSLQGPALYNAVRPLRATWALCLFSVQAELSSIVIFPSKYGTRMILNVLNNSDFNTNWRKPIIPTPMDKKYFIYQLPLMWFRPLENTVLPPSKCREIKIFKIVAGRNLGTVARYRNI